MIRGIESGRAVGDTGWEVGLMKMRGSTRL